MKSYFENKIAELRTKIENSNDVNEVRALGKEIDEMKEQIAKIDAAESRAKGGAFNPVATFAQNTEPTKREENVDKFDTLEYRKAFMEFACRNAQIPAEFRATTQTGDVGAVIPTTYTAQIIRELKTYGNLYAKVTKTNLQGGVEIPVLSLYPTASWIGETTPSTEQKLEAKETVSFKYFGLECRISQTLLASVVTLDAFQQLFIPLAVEAIAKALDIAIIKGAGTASPLGIVNDTRIPEGNVITLTSAEFASWGGWKKKVFAKMKKSYRNGEFIMAQGTFDGYIDGMEDKNGQPIGRVNYGIDGGETYRFGGKHVETVEDDVIVPYEMAETGDVVAIFVKLSDYVVNSNMQMVTVQWVDHDTNEKKTKVLLIADGKLADTHGVLVIKKGA